MIAIVRDCTNSQQVVSGKVYLYYESQGKTRGKCHMRPSGNPQGLLVKIRADIFFVTQPLIQIQTVYIYNQSDRVEVLMHQVIHGLGSMGNLSPCLSTKYILNIGMGYQTAQKGLHSILNDTQWKYIYRNKKVNFKIRSKLGRYLVGYLNIFKWSK